MFKHNKDNDPKNISGLIDREYARTFLLLVLVSAGTFVFVEAAYYLFSQTSPVLKEFADSLDNYVMR